MSKHKLTWKKKPVSGDYEAARSYLSLLLPASRINAILRALRASPVSQHSAKDLLRASGLPLLPPEEASVKDDLKKIGKGKALSPVLLVRGNWSNGIALMVADGYHRICAVYHHDEAAAIACQLAAD
jgi:hypothetical protein